MSNVTAFNFSSSEDDLDIFPIKKHYLKSKKTSFDKKMDFTTKKNTPYKKPKQKLSTKTWSYYSDDEGDF